MPAHHQRAVKFTRGGRKVSSPSCLNEHSCDDLGPLLLLLTVCYNLKAPAASKHDFVFMARAGYTGLGDIFITDDDCERKLSALDAVCRRKTAAAAASRAHGSTGGAFRCSSGRKQRRFQHSADMDIPCPLPQTRTTRALPQAPSTRSTRESTAHPTAPTGRCCGQASSGAHAPSV